MPVQIMSRSIRDEVYHRTFAAVRREIAGRTPLVGNCLEFAWQGYQIIKSWPGAPRTIIQAGSAQWPRVPPELDDGVSPTHFAYEWDPGSEAAVLHARGVVPILQRADGYVGPSLPEMHVWLASPDTNEVIDFTTGLWPDACVATLGLGWHAPKPPDYSWMIGTGLPDGVRYVATREAIECVIGILRQQGRR